MTDPTPEQPLLTEEQRARCFAATMAKPLLSTQGLASKTPPDVNDLIRLAAWLLGGEETDLYPYLSGDTIVLGPEIFVAQDHSVLCWKGSNYVPQLDDLREQA
jgi:hypothetical protein